MRTEPRWNKNLGVEVRKLRKKREKIIFEKEFVQAIITQEISNSEKTVVYIPCFLQPIRKTTLYSQS